MEWRWHQLDHMQIICTSLQTDNHAQVCNTELKDIARSTVKFVVLKNGKRLHCRNMSDLVHISILERRHGGTMGSRQWWWWRWWWCTPSYSVLVNS